MPTCVIGIDLGGTQLRAVLADREGTILQQVRMPTASAAGPAMVVAQMVTCVEQLQAQLTPEDTLLGIGVGAPGPVEPQRGIVFHTPNMRGWVDVPLRDLLIERIHTASITVGNDANLAVLGEWYFGGGQGCRNLLYVTISTGIGGGVICDGRLLVGHRGAAAEVGHMLIEDRTSWENLASGTALGAAAARLMPDYPDSILHSLATPETVTSIHVSQAAALDDSFAQYLMEREATLIGIGIANLLHLYGPERVLVGGGVVTANPWLLDGARTVAAQYAIADVYRTVPIALAQLGDQVGVLGAAALAFYAASAEQAGQPTLLPVR